MPPLQDAAARQNKQKKPTKKKTPTISFCVCVCVCVFRVARHARTAEIAMVSRLGPRYLSNEVRLQPNHADANGVSELRVVRSCTYRARLPTGTRRRKVDKPLQAHFVAGAGGHISFFFFGPTS